MLGNYLGFFIKDEVSEVFDRILMYGFHYIFYDVFKNA